MKAVQIDLSRTEAVGVRLLRAYLEFAERGVEALRFEVTQDRQRGFDSPFGRDVARALEPRGKSVPHRIGSGSFQINLALVDPARSRRYVLGVERHEATNHSLATARDRDRLRQQVLEDLGSNRMGRRAHAHDHAIDARMLGIVRAGSSRRVGSLQVQSHQAGGRPDRHLHE